MLKLRELHLVWNKNRTFDKKSRTMISFDTFVREQVEKAKPNAGLDVEGTINRYRQRVEESYTLVTSDWLSLIHSRTNPVLCSSPHEHRLL